MRRNAHQAAATARRARSENDGGSLSGDSWAGQMEADEQQFAGAGNRDRMAVNPNTRLEMLESKGVAYLCPAARVAMNTFTVSKPRGLGWRIHYGVEVTELSTNKQHTLSTASSLSPASRERHSIAFPSTHTHVSLKL